MKSFRFLTWLDVRREISRKTNYGKKLPEGVVRMRCFSDAIEVGLVSDDNRENVNNIIKEWFGDWYQEDELLIQLDLADATLPVEFISGESTVTNDDIEIRPFWEEIAYLETEVENKSNIIKQPEKYIDKLKLVAFYSFKGGVGRTLNLAAHIFALLDRAKEINKPINILVIDADLEAPGLTYWNRLEKQQGTVSLINFLEVYHYPPIEREEAISLFAREIKKSPKSEGKSTVYFLPACLDDKELLDTPILPENLISTSAWECGDAIQSLGQAVNADYVFVDLRAGISEISSPIIFDARFQRFLVTTITEQSLKGTCLVLEQIGRIAPDKDSIDSGRYYDPSLVVSMLTPELKSLPAFENALVKFQSAYVEAEEDNLYSTRLDTKETYFSQELLYINSWDEAQSKLSPTSVMEVARNWAKTQLEITESNLSSNQTQPQNRLPEVHKLTEICQRYEYAEQGEGEDLLVTEPLKNLAKNFRDKLPNIVSIGAKGAGKTFNYIQLSRFKYWENFLTRVDNLDKETETCNQQIYIFPFLQSGKLRDKAKDIINEARNKVITALNTTALNTIDFIHSEYVDRIKNAPGENWNEPQWTEFWINEIAKSIGISSIPQDKNTLSSISNELKNRGIRIVFLFDGLEDIFSDIASNQKEKLALKALIEDLPNKLSEIRQSNLGVIIFLRRDFLRNTITQNRGQFENLYSSYDLSWDKDSFLQLVLWICSQSNVIGTQKEMQKEMIDTLSKEELIEKLEQLWGKRLGSDNSKEAYTQSWVFAALTDFNGRLQARDIVRFLYNAANITINQEKELQFDKWSTSRLLPPQAIRRALKPCSEKKVEEAKEEYSAFKDWVDDTLPKYPKQRKIPFAVENFEMAPQIVRLLEEMGVIYEDKEKEDEAKFYMPEIFREGLGFAIAGGARPRVLVLKRKALGKANM
jgi:MinD-like ATPase involved in chromosome partitioning or flagellar assembly